MAESSIFWTTGATGDGASPYTQAQVIDWLRRTFINAPASEGILFGYANALVPAGTASPVSIATGAAMVYGFPYENTAAVNVAIATPSIGTTGHRIVLRASWAAQTVRIALLSSSDGVASIPALTQTANTTWEISLATLTITTGGVITLTDTRGFAHPNLMPATNSIETAAIVNDAVDDTKVGNRVPQFYRRQGNSSSNWFNPGANNYTPGSVRMQGGVHTLTITAGNAYAYSTITLPAAFSDSPMVLTGRSNDVPSADVISVAGYPESATEITVYAARSGTTGDLDVIITWLAIGPE